MHFSFLIYFKVDPMSIFDNKPDIEQLAKDSLEKRLNQIPDFFVDELNCMYSDQGIKKNKLALRNENREIMSKGIDYIWKHISWDKVDLQCIDETDSHAIVYELWLTYDDEK